MALFAEARRIIASMYRLPLSNACSGLHRVSRRSRALNRQIACMAVVPFSARESSTYLQEATGDPTHCEYTEKLTDDLFIVDDTASGSKCLIDGESLDRLFEIGKVDKTSCGSDIKSQTYFPASNSQSLNSILDKVILHSLGVDCNYVTNVKTSTPVPCVSSNTMFSDYLTYTVMYCDNQSSSAASGDKTSNHERGLPSIEELTLVRDHLAKYIPRFFTERHNYKLYSPDLIFENNYEDTPFVTTQISGYVLYLAKKRALAHFKYASVNMHILKITQHEEDGTVRVRWKVTGIPQFRILLFWKWLPWSYRASLKDESEWIDGFSTFYVQSKTGLVYKHQVDRILPDEERSREKRVSLIERLRRRFAPQGVIA